MNTLTTAFAILCTCALASPTAQAQLRTAEEPRFRIEIQATSEGGPTFTVTNLAGKAVTACVFEISSSPEEKGKSKMVWDALLQNESAIEPGASVLQHLVHAVEGPLPDKVEVIAGIWADGEAFGQPTWVKTILANRAMRALEYDRASTFLKQGLEQNWNRDQFIQALNDKPNSGSIHVIRSTLMGNPELAKKPELLRREVQMMLDSFTQKLDRLRDATPRAGEPDEK